MSGGRLTVQLYAAGELVPALQVFDAVYAGTAEMGTRASFYWAGKIKAAPFFTTVPFGLTPAEHAGLDRAWRRPGPVGRALRAVRPQAVHGRQFEPADGRLVPPRDRGPGDLKGLKLRSAGLGGEVFQRLGAVTVSLGVPEIYPALQSGTIDGVEFLGPASDLAAGFYQIAKLLLLADLHQAQRHGRVPRRRRDAWEALPPDLQAVVADACAAENAYTLAEADWRDGEALATLVDNGTASSCAAGRTRSSLRARARGRGDCSPRSRPTGGHRGSGSTAPTGRHRSGSSPGRASRSRPS